MNVTEITAPRKTKKINLSDESKLQELRDIGFQIIVTNGIYTATRPAGEDEDFEHHQAASPGALYTKIGIEGKPPQFTEEIKSSEPQSEDDGDAPAEDLPEGFEELKSDSKGNAYLPGTAPIVNAELNAAAHDHFEKKSTRMEWTEKEKEAKDVLTLLSHKYEELFKTDTDTGKKTYRAGDIIVELIVEEKENVKTRMATEDDD